MSRWAHACCVNCFEKRHGSKLAHKLSHPEEENCCYCGSVTAAGMYDREDPAKTLCKGIHNTF